ncbi:uncharacterized protein LOC125725236 [Brienomyrus brachyistius]|uniref:uncharacterized protein LOC125725236 n=1 Tax=Brienomyrus brachyistius TaxID=42636 RepID=UPI0020B21C4C|nr:uncharacterized protein LOC125725236 [Brienomyrus brachyistius]XP_048857961.1 uncharacterized protein LOC125725236 [Brienomyrus brachyistius]XP_048857962.1 uncharacterized protein LOC125725236 [Brienomyrus brachyistius]
MATGLMRRYREAGVPPPKLLYVDRDCCSPVGKSRAAAMFCEWEELVVRLDVWHPMRRFAVGVTTDSHQLYGLFMAKLLSCISEWDSADVARLMQAVRAELEGKQGIVGLSEDQLTGRLTAKMLARHCRRRTRGAQETEQLIAQLLAAFRDVKDTMGIPLLDNQRMDAMWDTQRHPRPSWIPAVHGDGAADQGRHRPPHLPLRAWLHLGVVPPPPQPLHPWHLCERGEFPGLLAGRVGAVERGQSGGSGRPAGAGAALLRWAAAGPQAG